ncbi:importin-4-like isoform X1 [Octopus sinensis]|uniref:Importin-4-like isoform X1 n=1 Tax=Octopus sinensis TaxID=2607531 RepID=A0A6P7SIL3_9MOLL|nr:importin-4-like isoform X1 [Octopus sinensis]
MAFELENIILQLFTPDSDVVKKATDEMKLLMKNQDIVPLFCQILGTCEKSQVRQYAAVLLRRKIQRKHQYFNLSEDIRKNIRGNILQLFLQETEKCVQTAIAQIIATVAKHELPNQNWPEFFSFILEYSRNHNPRHREIGIFLMHKVAAMATEQLKVHLISVLELLSEALLDQETLMVPYFAILTLSELVIITGDDEMKQVQKLIPPVIDVVKKLLAENQEWACESMELFDSLLEFEVAIVVPYLKNLVQLCLEIIPRKDLENMIRVKAMSTIKLLITLKKKAILKKNFNVLIMNVIFEEICAETDDEFDIMEENDEEADTPTRYAAQVIDTLALHLPPEKVISKLLPLVENALKSPDKFRRRAAYTSLAMIAEGCSEYIINNHLQAFVSCVCQGMEDNEGCVKNAAFFALGRFAEYLQPEINNMAPHLLPLLFNNLLKTLQENPQNINGLTKTYYALERICENLGEAILPFLPDIMDHLMNVLKTSSSLKTKEVAVSVIGAVANAAGQGMQPYFQTVLNDVNEILNIDNEDFLTLHVQAIDTLAVLARNIDSNEFLPIADNVMQMGVHLIEQKDDPDLRRCVYGLFASMSVLLKDEMAKYLPEIVPIILSSVKSSEGVQLQYKEDVDDISTANFIDIDDDENTEENLGDQDTESEDEEEKLYVIQVENSFVDEKADACTVLGDLAVNIGTVFMPYLQNCYDAVTQVLVYPLAQVRKAVVTTLAQFCLSLHQVFQKTNNLESQEVLSGMIKTVVPMLLERIKEDNDRMTVTAAVDALVELLTKIGSPYMCEDGMIDSILTRTREVFSHQTTCQDDNDDDDDGEEEDQEAEYDAYLVESAGEILPATAKLIGGKAFMPYFESFIPDLLKKLKSHNSIADRSFAIGTLAETLEACGEASAGLTSQFYPIFMKITRDPDSEVRNNAVFALGVIISNGGSALQNDLLNILTELFTLLQNESCDLVKDNICGTVCRIINQKPDGLPLEQVLPVIIQCLPLKEDFEENTTVFQSLLSLFAQGHPQLIVMLPELLKVIAEVLGTTQINKETESLLVQFVKNVHASYPDALEKAKLTISAELGAKLNTCGLMT